MASRGSRSGRGGAAPPEMSPTTFHGFTSAISMALGRRDVCISFGVAPGRRRVAILDAQGHERSGRDLEKGSLPGLWVADFDGDGRDELLFHDGGSLRACRRDLSELWSLPTRETVRELLPGAQGRPATRGHQPIARRRRCNRAPDLDARLGPRDLENKRRLEPGPRARWPRWHDDLPCGHADLGRRPLSRGARCHGPAADAR